MIERSLNRQAFATQCPMEVSIGSQTQQTQGISNLAFHIRIQVMEHGAVLEIPPYSVPMSKSETRIVIVLWVLATFRTFKHSLCITKCCSSAMPERVAHGLLQVQPRVVLRV